jgi:hypothetical protein
MMDGYNERMEKGKEEKRERQMGTLMDDFVFGEEGTRDEDDEMDESWEDDGSVEYSDDDEEVEDIETEEVEFLGPVQPFDHSDCIEGECKASTPAGLRRAGKDYGILMSPIPILFIPTSCGNQSIICRECS